MFERILVPMDGSPLAERVLPYATGLVRLHGGRLILFGGLTGGGATSDLQSILDTIAGQLRTEGYDASVVVRACRQGHVGAAIVEAAHVQGADLVAMASHGRDDLGRLVLGSVAEHVLQRAETPILLVTPLCDRSWPPDGPRRLLIPLDGSRLAEEAVGSVRPLIQSPGMHTTFLGVVDVRGAGYTGGLSVGALIEASREQTARYLQGVAAAEGEGRLSLETVVETGVPSERIASVARTREADLIVMATRGRGGIGRLLVGSVALAVAHETRVPLLLVRPVRAAGESGTHAVAHEPSQGAGDGEMVSLAVTRRELRLLATALERLQADSGGLLPDLGEVERLLARLRQASAS